MKHFQKRFFNFCTSLPLSFLSKLYVAMFKTFANVRKSCKTMLHSTRIAHDLKRGSDLYKTMQIVASAASGRAIAPHENAGTKVSASPCQFAFR